MSSYGLGCDALSIHLSIFSLLVASHMYRFTSFLLLNFRRRKDWIQRYERSLSLLFPQGFPFFAPEIFKTDALSISHQNNSTIYIPTLRLGSGAARKWWGALKKFGRPDKRNKLVNFLAVALYPSRQILTHIHFPPSKAPRILRL